MTKNPPHGTLPSLKPQIRLVGGIDEQMLLYFLGECDKLPGAGPITIELTTMGGEAESARRIALEVGLLAQQRDVYLLGKTYVYSAGITVMAAVPVSHRYLSRDTVLLVHERRFQRTVQFDGPLKAAIAIAEDLLAEMRVAQELERRGFAQLAQGSQFSADELRDRVIERDWYLGAEEALSLKLVAGLVG